MSMYQIQNLLYIFPLILCVNHILFSVNNVVCKKKNLKFYVNNVICIKKILLPSVLVINREVSGASFENIKKIHCGG